MFLNDQRARDLIAEVAKTLDDDASTETKMRAIRTLGQVYAPSGMVEAEGLLSDPDFLKDVTHHFRAAGASLSQVHREGRIDLFYGVAGLLVMGIPYAISGWKMSLGNNNLPTDTPMPYTVAASGFVLSLMWLVYAIPLGILAPPTFLLGGFSLWMRHRMWDLLHGEGMSGLPVAPIVLATLTPLWAPVVLVGDLLSYCTDALLQPLSWALKIHAMRVEVAVREEIARCQTPAAASIALNIAVRNLLAGCVPELQDLDGLPFEEVVQEMRVQLREAARRDGRHVYHGKSAAWWSHFEAVQRTQTGTSIHIVDQESEEADD